MNLAKMNRMLMIFWFALAIITTIMVIVMGFIDGFNKWAFYFLVPVICLILAVVRRFMWKKLQKSEAFRDSK